MFSPISKNDRRVTMAVIILSPEMRSRIVGPRSVTSVTVPISLLRALVLGSLLEMIMLSGLT